jgi:hypothetical protein
MEAQVETGILQVARCCFRKAQACRRDLGTLGLCHLSQGAAGYADLVSGTGEGQGHTPANFPQARQQSRRIGHKLSVKALLFSPRYFAHNFHPNTPSLATQDMQGSSQKRRSLLQIALGIDMSPPS